jgi:DNA-binding NarL/FixJ family response regulator
MNSVLQRAETSSVVIVDDTEDVRLVVRLTFEARGGFEVVGEAANGRDGVEVVRRTQPDVVLLDLRMPVMSGLDALPRILEACPTARVIVLSGFEADEMAQHALDSGAHGYAQKGTGAADLVAYVVRVLEGPHPTPALGIPRQGGRSSAP